MSVAAGARGLAKLCRMSPDESEILFVSGLLHDIGKLLLITYLGDSGKSAPAGTRIVDHERSAIGLDHAEAGALVSAKWNLAVEIQDVIKAHHEIGQPSNKSVAVVRLADAVAHERGTGYLPGRSPVEPVQAADLAAIGMDQESWATVRDFLFLSMDEAVGALGNLSS